MKNKKINLLIFVLGEIYRMDKTMKLVIFHNFILYESLRILSNISMLIIMMMIYYYKKSISNKDKN